MAPETSSANITALIHYADTAKAINTQLCREAGQLKAALERFTASCTEPASDIGPALADKLCAYAWRMEPKDEQVREVGLNFKGADIDNDCLCVGFSAATMCGVPEARPGSGYRTNRKGDTFTYQTWNEVSSGAQRHKAESVMAALQRDPRRFFPFDIRSGPKEIVLNGVYNLDPLLGSNYPWVVKVVAVTPTSFTFEVQSTTHPEALPPGSTIEFNTYAAPDGSIYLQQSGVARNLNPAQRLVIPVTEEQIVIKRTWPKMAEKMREHLRRDVNLGAVAG